MPKKFVIPKPRLYAHLGVTMIEITVSQLLSVTRPATKAEISQFSLPESPISKPKSSASTSPKKAKSKAPTATKPKARKKVAKKKAVKK